MIQSIELKNFKCYTHQEFILDNLTVFCGNNSVGKSTAIQALAILFQSSFRNEVSINHTLVDLGAMQDIFSAYAIDEVLSVAITYENIKYIWGVNSGDAGALKNNLTRMDDTSRETDDLVKYYFTKKGFQFLHAERCGPRNYFENNHDHSIQLWLGSKGEYIFQVLTELDNNGAKLDNNDKRILKTEEGPSIRRNINNWMSEISPGFNFQSYSISSAGISHAEFQAYGSSHTKPINMGFGLSYSISIVVALLVTKPGGVVIIENPEAHLHPRGQSYLGRLIAKAALAGVQVIIETHSDHVLNGIRVIARLDQDFQVGKFKVFYISGAFNEASSAEEIIIGKKGELSSWPKGFFDQQAYDVKTLLKGEEVKE